MDRVKRRWWTTTTTGLALVVVMAAVISGMFQLAVMALPGYRAQLSDYVSRVADRPIDIGGVALVWHHLQPQLELNDIVLYGDDGITPALSAQRLRIGFGFLRLLRGDTFPTQIELAGIEMVVAIDRDNHVTLRGFDTVGPARSTHDWQRDLARFDAIRVSDCDVLVEDARLAGGNPQFHLARAEARQRGGGAIVEARVELPRFMGETAEFEAEVEGDLTRAETLDGQWSLTLEDLSRLPWLEARLPGQPALQLHNADLALSGRIEQGALDSFDIDFEAEGIAARRADHVAKLTAVGVEARARRNGGSWTLDVPRFEVTGSSGPWPQTRLRMQYTPVAGGGSQLEADADFVRLQDLVPWVMLADGADARVLGVSGQLHSLIARARFAPSAAPTYALRARLDHFGVEPEGEGPGFSGLSGEVSATEKGGRLSVAAQPFELRFAHVFAQPVMFDSLGGALDWTRDEAGWHIEMPELSWTLEGTQGQSKMSLLLPAAAGESPRIALSAQFSADDVTRLKPYKPAFWHEHLRNWLDTAIVAGRVPSGHLDIEGNLADFPFRDGGGRFDLELDVADGQLAYAPNWPEADRVAARLNFTGTSLRARVDGGRLAGGRIERVDAQIPEFRDAQLELQGEVDGDAARFYTFLRQSPIAPRLAGLLNQTEASGNASVNVKLAIPLKDVQQTQFSGAVKLKGVELRYTGLAEPFRDLGGDVAFDADGARSDGVTGSFYDVPVTARLSAEGHGASRLVAEADYALEADGARLSQFVPGLLRPHLEGSAHWRAETVLGPGSDGVSITSDLVGIGVDLPAPAGKIAEESAPIAIHLAAPAAAPAGETSPPVALRVDVSYQGRLGTDVVLTRDDNNALVTDRVLVRLGEDSPPQATEPGVRVVGTVEHLDVPEWVDAIGRSSAGESGASARDTGAASEALGKAMAGALPRRAALRLETLDVMAGRLQLAGYNVGSVRLRYRPRDEGGWVTQLSGEGAEGEVRWLEGPVPKIEARLDKLKAVATKLPERSAAEATAEAAVAQATSETANDGRKPIDPTQMPVFDFDCLALELGEAKLGHVRVLTQRIEGGQRLTLLDARGEELDLTGAGEWLRRDGQSSATMRFNVESRSIGPTVEGLGYARNLEAEKSRFEGTLGWNAAAAGLDWRQARGAIDLELEKGSLRAVEPGAGRVLGLLNFYALPRRLTLDFRDVTSEGLGFDKVMGTFKLGDGNAVTDKLEIRSPSLRIDLHGRVGLAARDYDQTVSVYPDVSGGVTLGALLLGGPAAGVITLLAQQLLDKPLDQVTQLTYRVTGSWDNPQVSRPDKP
jgi:uncharacterized protein (TIGR02099 family)